jgi:hypothetical protein
MVNIGERDVYVYPKSAKSINDLHAVKVLKADIYESKVISKKD